MEFSKNSLKNALFIKMGVLLKGQGLMVFKKYGNFMLMILCSLDILVEIGIQITIF